MIEFHADQMSEKEMIEAADGIFRAQEKDFEKIKNEKWYKTFFHAITLNQDGKKYAVRSINSLAKLQQLFMNVYVRNYQKTHEQLDAVIETVVKNSNAIRKLYENCILRLEEQEGLETLDEQDAKILALFLAEYRDENDLVPPAVQEYNRNVLMAVQQRIPLGNLDNHQIRNLHKPKVVYRCFMEQCAVAGTIDTQEWSDKIYDDIRDFELGENSKNEIKELVKREAEIAGVEYFAVKYRESADEFDNDLEIDVNNAENTEKIESKQDDRDQRTKDGFNEHIEAVDTSILREPLRLSGIIPIEGKRIYENKVIHFSSAIITCTGELEFRNCAIHYNEDQGSQIRLKNGASLKILGCMVVCHGENKDFFIETDSDTTCTIEKSKFVNCINFIKGSFGGFNKFLFYGNECHDCCSNFLFFFDNQQSVIEESRFWYVSKPAFFSVKRSRVIHGGKTAIRNCDISYTGSKVDESDYLDSMEFIEGIGRDSDMQISNCVFTDMHNCINGGALINNCIFKRCQSAISGNAMFGGYNKIIDNLFIDCTVAIQGIGNGSLIKNCQFYGGGQGGYITVYNAASIESCEFVKLKCTPSGLDKALILIGSASKSAIKKNGATKISECVFNGIQLVSKEHVFHSVTYFTTPSFIIAVGGAQDPVGMAVADVAGCVFNHCATDNKTGDVIELEQVHCGRFGREKNFKVIDIWNCRGYNQTTDLTHYKEPTDFKLRVMDGKGCVIGSRLNKNHSVLESTEGLMKSSAIARTEADPTSTKKMFAPETKYVAVELTDVGSWNKFKIVKIIHEILGLDLNDAKRAVESTPVLLKSSVPEIEAQKLKTKVEAEGAAVTLK